MEELERMKLDAACALCRCNGALEVLSLAANLDHYEYLPAENDEMLGALEIETRGIKIPEWLADYINYKELGWNIRFRQDGMFVGMGYIYKIGNCDEVTEENAISLTNCEGKNKDHKMGESSGDYFQDDYNDKMGEEDEFEQ